jgi:hypothetical protein
MGITFTDEVVIKGADEIGAALTVVFQEVVHLD